MVTKMTKKLISKSDKIYIAGHKGMAGSAICRAFQKKGYQNLLTLERSELDLENISNVNKFFEINKPDVVVLSAAKLEALRLIYLCLQNF